MEKRHIRSGDQRGSIMIVSLLVLALMTILGISASETVLQEAYITRNIGLYNQNIRLVESGLMETLQQLLIRTRDATNPAVVDALMPASGSTDVFVNSDKTWEDNGIWDDWYDLSRSGRMLDATNSRVPDFIADDDSRLINNRGEKLNEPLRCAILGWDIDAGSSMKATGPSRKEGRIIGEYMSQFGMVRMEAGVVVKF